MHNSSLPQAESFQYVEPGNPVQATIQPKIVDTQDLTPSLPSNYLQNFRSQSDTVAKLPVVAALVYYEHTSRMALGKDILPEIPLAEDNRFHFPYDNQAATAARPCVFPSAAAAQAFIERSAQGDRGQEQRRINRKKLENSTVFDASPDLLRDIVCESRSRQQQRYEQLREAFTSQKIGSSTAREIARSVLTKLTDLAKWLLGL